MANAEGISSRVWRNQPIVFEEALEYLRGRAPMTAREFYRLARKYRNHAFTVSGYTSLQVLNKFLQELERAIETGETQREFRDRMNSFLSEKGYEGLTPFQADNIFRTNIQTAYQAGHYERMTDPDVMAVRPYWMYDAVADSHTRPSHLAMNGKVFPADSKVWDTWYPPNGYRCRCTVRTLSRRQVEQLGLEVLEDVPDRVELPDGRMAFILPDPKFSTNPAKASFQPDLNGYPQSLVNAYQRKQKGGSP